MMNDEKMDQHDRRDLPETNIEPEHSANKSSEKEENKSETTDNSKLVISPPPLDSKSNKDPVIVSGVSIEQADSTTLDGQVRDIHTTLSDDMDDIDDIINMDDIETKYDDMETKYDDMETKYDNIYCNETLEDSLPNNSPDYDSSVMREKLHEAEQMYTKYFNKAVQDSTVIIAHILNMITLSNKQLIFQTKNAINIEERLHAEQLHAKQKEVLEYRLYLNFVHVVIIFDDDDYTLAFQLFFLCIFIEFQFFDDPPEISNFTTFGDLTLQILSSLKGKEAEYACIIKTIKSKNFYSDCIDLLGLIENGKIIEPEVTDKMALFSVSTLVGREHFLAAIHLVYTSSNGDLGELIDYGQVMFRNKSKFKDPDTPDDPNTPLFQPVPGRTAPWRDHELETLR